GEQATVYNKTLLVNTIILIYLLLSVILYLYISYLPALLVLSVVLAGLSLVVTNFFLISRSFPATELVSNQYDKGGTLKRFWSITAAYLILWIMAKLLIIHPHYELIRLWDILILMVGMAAYVYQGTITWGQSLWKKFNQPIFGSGKEYLNYKIYCTSLILLLSIIPTLIFFSINYKTEQEILFKQKAHSLV